MSKETDQQQQFQILRYLNDCVNKLGNFDASNT